jgi:hypothetical protein
MDTRIGKFSFDSDAEKTGDRKTGPHSGSLQQTSVPMVTDCGM